MLAQGIGDILRRICTGAVVIEFIRAKDVKVAEKLYNNADLCEQMGPNAYWMFWAGDLAKRLER